LKHFTAYIGLAILTIGLSACTGGSTGSASFVPQSQVHQAQDFSPGGPQSQARHAEDFSPGGPQ